MAAEAEPARPVPPRPPRDPISRELIDTVLARALALFGLAFGAQGLQYLWQQLDDLRPSWAIVVGVTLYGGFLAVAVTSLLRRGVETASAFVAVAYLVALVTWPLSVHDAAVVQAETPWLWYLCTVATATAIFAWRTWVAVAYTVVAPVVFGLLRLTPSGGAVGPARAGLDVMYAGILGGAVVVLVVLLRQAASAVDRAQAAAVAQYASAVREHATELERLQVDAIVHDSVLTTFIQAARAHTPDEKALATTMARNAISHVSSAARSGPSDAAEVLLTELRDRLCTAVSEVGVPVELTTGDLEGRTVPAPVAEALASAAVQAVVNSARHAGDGDGVHRSVSLRWDRGRTLLDVVDTGRGFDPVHAPVGRMGVRVSIRERVASAGGTAVVDSAPGRGTRIRLAWPADGDGPADGDRPGRTGVDDPAGVVTATAQGSSADDGQWAR